MTIQFPYDKLPKITSPYGWRTHPTQGIRKHHNGVDFGAAAGTWVEAIHRGKVIFAGPSKSRLKNGKVGGFGWHVMILHKIHGEYVISVYCHMQEGSLTVKKGDTVNAGTPVGKTGSTGDSTGPHLHFEIVIGKVYKWRGDGKGYYDPIKFIKAAQAKYAALAEALAVTADPKPDAAPAVKATPVKKA